MISHREVKLPGTLFTKYEAVHKKCETSLKDLTKNGVFEDWKKRYYKYIQLQGEYYEKYHVPYICHCRQVPFRNTENVIV
ncbi:hypothetical protein ANN_03150 [Periplaneta americana]|uniref:Uncharacterized protein n=1 Tax=Periplaneta americana TaxID=6978 RepID=A0ABQ8U353_PERAM|nr:hypothetical protein ANN_03150 [Periplaneta americana]